MVLSRLVNICTSPLVFKIQCKRHRKVWSQKPKIPRKSHWKLMSFRIEFWRILVSNREKNSKKVFSFRFLHFHYQEKKSGNRQIYRSVWKILEEEQSKFEYIQMDGQFLADHCPKTSPKSSWGPQWSPSGVKPSEPNYEASKPGKKSNWWWFWKLLENCAQIALKLSSYI